MAPGLLSCVAELNFRNKLAPSTTVGSNLALILTREILQEALYVGTKQYSYRSIALPL